MSDFYFVFVEYLVRNVPAVRMLSHPVSRCVGRNKRFTTRAVFVVFFVELHYRQATNSTSEMTTSFFVTEIMINFQVKVNYAVDYYFIACF